MMWWYFDAQPNNIKAQHSIASTASCNATDAECYGASITVSRFIVHLRVWFNSIHKRQATEVSLTIYANAVESVARGWDELRWIWDE